MGLQKKDKNSIADGPLIEKTLPVQTTVPFDSGKTATALYTELVGKAVSPYQTTEDNRSRRILRQGVYQHTLVSPALAGLQFRGADEFLVIVKDVAEKVIRLIEDK